jgi:hypothetical protein
MKWQTTAVLLVIAAALAGYIYLTDLATPPEQKEKLFLIDPIEITELEIRRPAGKLRFRREGEAWKMSEPAACGAQSPAVEGVLGEMADLRRPAAVITLSPGETGLDHPTYFVSFRDRAGETHKLLVGSESPMAGTYYARSGDVGRILTVTDGLVKLLNKETAEFRDPRVVDFKPNSITAAELHYADRMMRLERADDGWRLVQPVAIPADANAVEALLRKLNDLSAKRFIDDAPSDPAAHGLDRPLLRASLERREETPLEIVLGSKLPIEGLTERYPLYHFRTSEAPSVYAAEVISQSDFVKTAKDFREKRLLGFVLYDVRSVQIEGKDQKLKLEKEDDAWRITEPSMSNSEAKQEAVDRFLSDLLQGSFEDLIEATPKLLKKYDLDPPLSRISVTDKQGRARTLLIGRIEKELCYVQVEGEEAILTAPKKIAELAGRTPSDFQPQEKSDE